MPLNLRREDGFTLIELAVAAALTVIVLGLLSSALIVTNEAQVFGSRQSEALNEARVALNELGRDLRNAMSGSVVVVDPSAAPECEPEGMCLEAVLSTAAGPVSHRWRIDGTEMVRERKDPLSGAYVADRVLAREAANATLSPVETIFACSGQPKQIEVHLAVRPSQDREDVYRIDTTYRPRNDFSGCTP